VGGGRDPDRRTQAGHVDAQGATRSVYLANIVRLHRGVGAENRVGEGKLLKASFPKSRYADVAGLCKVVSVKEIEAQGWSLNPGRYAGVADRVADNFDFKERLEELNEELERLNGEARELEAKIAENVSAILEA
jgi:type I restriction enzyme M protein